ncbi:hypothetical protein Tco_0790259 [Tanacetum coccineum]
MERGFLSSSSMNKKDNGEDKTKKGSVLANVDKNAANGNVNGYLRLQAGYSANSKVNSVNGISQRKEGSFASLLRPKEVTNKLRFRTLVNKEKVKCFDCVLPKAAASLIKSSLKNSIVGFSCWEGPLFPAYSEDGLSLIATQIGKPVMLDAFTSSIYVLNQGVESVLLCVSIMISSASTLKGRSHDLCPKRVRDEVPMAPSMAVKPSTMEDNEKEFVEVHWQPKKSVDSKGGSNTTSPSGTTKESDKGVKEDVQNPKVSDHAGTSSSNLHVNKDQEESLWSRFNKGKENAKSKSSELEDESDDDEVYMPHGGGFIDGMEDDLECYDGYRTHVYDLTPQEQAFCDQYDIRLNSRGRK